MVASYPLGNTKYMSVTELFVIAFYMALCNSSLYTSNNKGISVDFCVTSNKSFFTTCKEIKQQVICLTIDTVIL